MLYLNILNEEARYARILKPIPTPRFFVLLMVMKSCLKDSELRLSAAFMLKDKKILIQLELRKRMN